MTNNLRRRDWIAAAPMAAAVTYMPRLSAQAVGQLPPPPPQLKPEMVKEYVGKSHGDLSAVKELSKLEPMLVRAAWDQGAGDWETGLGAASHMGRRDIAQFLIGEGARIDVFAVAMLGEVAAVKAMLAAFPDLHKTPGPHGIPLLSHAVVGKKDAFEVFQLLIASGANVNAAAWRGITVLMQATIAGQADMVRALLDAGADASVKTPAGMTALDFARKNNNAAIIGLLTKA